MFKSNSIKWTISLIVIALIIAVGVTISTDNPTFTPQTAIGQTSDSFNQDFEYLERANRAFIEVVNRAKPAVVQVTTTRLVSTSGSQSPFDFFRDDDLFEFWFGPRERRERRDSDEREEEKQEVPGGLGSGVIVSEEGYILTNNHVIEGAEEVQVILPDGREYHAEFIGRDTGRQGTDLAVLKIDGKNLPALPIGNSEKLQIGEWVIAIGSPFGLAQTVTRGMVSAKGRSVGIVQYADFIQTDAAINRGNSGGALINIRGELIGINTAIATGGGFSQGNVGVGFAIPINLAKRIMSQLIEKGEVERGWLGVSLQPIDYDLAEKLKLEEPRGALITQAFKGMPAEKAGIRRGDVIIEFDKVAIRDSNHLMHVVAAAGVGKTVEVKVIRAGEEKVLKVKLGKRTQEAVARLDGRPGRFVPDEDGTEAFAGIHVQGLTDELAAKYGYEGENGVIVAAVERRSAAARARIGVGTLIQEIEGVEISNLKDYREHTRAVKDKSKILLYVRQPNGGAAYITLENPSN